jgi:hypothetical protein
MIELCLPKRLVDRLENKFDKYEVDHPALSRTEKVNLTEETYLLCLYILFCIANGKDSLNFENTSFRQSTNINSVKMRRIVNKYERVLSLLSDGDKPIIQRGDSYSTGNGKVKAFSKTCRFHINLDNSPISKVRVTKAKNLSKLRQEITEKSYPDFIQQYYKQVLSKIYLEAEQAENYLIQNYKEDKEGYAEHALVHFYRAYQPVYNIIVGNHYLVLERSGRLHHNFSSLKNQLRQFLRIEREPDKDWVEVDISACSAFLLANYLTKKGVKGKDVGSFSRLASSDGFYTRLYEYCEFDSYKEERDKLEELSDYKGNKDKIKSSFIKFLNRGKIGNTEYGSKQERLFYKVLYSCFPNVFREIEKINIDADTGEDKNSNLYQILTPLESSVMVNYLIPQLLERKLIAITRHDGVLCLERDSKAIKNIIEEGFQNILGQIPTIKIKKINYEAI